ncbi:hypothetical protein SAMN02910369_00016 [Lachnospiraceae bacterium NE2001]|nr:hypothetical protein SAMN02910369_00016 [Lachnospiraceae bacterium NE2001]
MAIEIFYKEYLFNKHILVNDMEVPSNKNQFETLFALANLFNIRIVQGEKLVDESMIKFASKQLGENVPAPFYKGFPESVRALSPDQLLFDQMVHYIVTYGFGHFSEAGHSLFEEQFERTAFKESAAIKDFIIVDEKEAILKMGEFVNDLLAGTRPLSEEQYGMVNQYIYDYKFVPADVASKNTAIRLIIDFQNVEFAQFISLSDVIKLVDELNYIYYENENIKKLNLKNQDRKFITEIIDKLFELGRVDIRNCYEKKKIWNGLLHHIHYKAKSKEAQQFLDAMRGNENQSVYSEFEKNMTERNIRAAVDALKSGKGSAAVLRQLNYIMSRCESVGDMEYVLSCMDTKNVIVLMQLIIQYAQYKNKSEPRSFKFTKYDKLRVHTETAEEQKNRQSAISKGTARMLSDRLKDNLARVLKGRLGKVYIDPEMKNYALPLQEATSQGGFGVLTKGSKIQIPETKKIRAFTYWEKVNDIDLSVFGIESNGNKTEFSWRTMAGKQSQGITYSGDETSGYNGGSEYFDIELEQFKLEHPQIRYLIFCDNVYSGSHFTSCFCKAGYMTRDLEDSGEVYEPKTVQSSFVIDCASTFAYLFGIDLKTNEFIWLNIARDSNARVAGTTSMDFILDYFHITDIINVYTFFEMMATEVVDNMADADVIVTNKTVEPQKLSDTESGAAPEKEIIREYDTERIIALMNQ